jgi:hypothetical protein
MPPLRRAVQGCTVTVVSGILIRATPEEQPNYFDISVLRRPLQRGPAALVRGVRICTMLKEELNHVRMPIL